MKKRLLYIATLLIMSLTFNFCENINEPVLFDGVLVQFDSKDAYMFVGSEGSAIQLNIELVAAQQDNDVTATLSVNTASSTAEEGVHFTLSGTTVNIPAGSSTGEFTVNGIFDDLESGVTYELVLDLEGDLVGTTDKNSITIYISQFCNYAQATFTGVYDCVDPWGAYQVELFADAGDPGVLLLDNFWGYVEPGEQLELHFDGNPGQTIQIPEQDIIFWGGDPGTVSGSGSYNGCTGTLEIEVRIDIPAWGSTYNETHYLTPAVTKSITSIKQKRW